jgi:SAM-dependent methyltransferase
MTQTEDEYRAVGDAITEEFAELVALGDDETILDVGSGYGRIAAALWRRGHRGRYVGMDILPRHIAWCREHMTPATDGLHTFLHLDVRNARYNPRGTIAPTEVDLDIGVQPDAVLLNSVFTHMYGDAVTHYLQQLAVHLAPDGRIVATFFLINESQQRSEAARLSPFPLRHRIDGASRCWSRQHPLHVIAYHESWVHRVVEEAGLRVAETRLGAWCGRRSSRFQDTLLLVPKR